MDKQKFNKYSEIFLEANAKLNLISKNDEKFLWEKHIFDSLAIEEFFEKYSITNLKEKTLLDIGCGGGLPSVPIAINYPELKVMALDSIRKKITAVNYIKDKLQIKNLTTICDRAENINEKNFDFITSRAVASLKTLIPYAAHLLSDDGYFIAYKSIKAQEEIKDAEFVIKKYKFFVDSIIEYTLPLEDNYTRNLIIIKRKSL